MHLADESVSGRLVRVRAGVAELAAAEAVGRGPVGGMVVVRVASVVMVTVADGDSGGGG